MENRNSKMPFVLDIKSLDKNIIRYPPKVWLVHQNEIDALIAEKMIVASELTEDIHYYTDMQEAANQLNQMDYLPDIIFLELDYYSNAYHKSTGNFKIFFNTLDNSIKKKADLLIAFVLSESDVPEEIDNSLFPVSFSIHSLFTAKDLDHLIKLIKG